MSRCRCSRVLLGVKSRGNLRERATPCSFATKLTFSSSGILTSSRGSSTPHPHRFLRAIPSFSPLRFPECDDHWHNPYTLDREILVLSVDQSCRTVRLTLLGPLSQASSLTFFCDRIYVFVLAPLDQLLVESFTAGEVVLIFGPSVKVYCIGEMERLAMANRRRFTAKFKAREGAGGGVRAARARAASALRRRPRRRRCTPRNPLLAPLTVSLDSHLSTRSEQLQRKRSLSKSESKCGLSHGAPRCFQVAIQERLS